jgi:LSD1 subclass zinc finger protein
MSHVVPCPSCRNPLRLPAELLGQSVRCPACQTVFEAAAPSTPAVPAVPALALDDGNPTAAAPPPRPLWGAVEIESGGGRAPPPLPREPAPAPSSEPRRPQPGDEADLIRCPECRVRLPAGSTRCLRCGERLDGDSRPRRPRPPAEPHRGGVVLTLGILSIVFSFAAPIGLALGIPAWVMGQGDLAKMRRREMDREGEGLTNGGWICGMLGVILSAVLGLAILMYFVSRVEEDDPFRRTFPPTVRPMPVQNQKF